MNTNADGTQVIMELKASGDAMSADIKQAQLVQGRMIEENESLQQLQEFSAFCCKMNLKDCFASSLEGT